MTTITRPHERIFPTQIVFGERNIISFMAAVPENKNKTSFEDNYTFTILSGIGDFENILSLLEIFSSLEPVKINNWIDLERLSIQIAKDTRRGKGNVLFHNNMDLLKHIKYPWYDIIRCDFLKPNEMIMTYIGSTDYDAGLVRISRVEKIENSNYEEPGYKSNIKNWVKHPHFEKYFKKIIIEGADIE